MEKRIRQYNKNAIYIPIWLDLLFDFIIVYKLLKPNLHSNMVRFIIILIEPDKDKYPKFTFQYG